MRTGDLVIWSTTWLSGKNWRSEEHAKQIGILIRPWSRGWIVYWSDGITRHTHYDFLEKL